MSKWTDALDRGEISYPEAMIREELDTLDAQRAKLHSDKAIHLTAIKRLDDAIVAVDQHHSEVQDALARAFPRSAEELDEMNPVEARAETPADLTHEFVGRHDRWCEVCNRPDRDPIHRVAPPDFVGGEAPVAPGLLQRWRGEA